MDIVERLHFDAARCEATFSKGVASNIEEAAAEIERLRAALTDARDALRNDFEPDNQSKAWHRANTALAHQQKTGAEKSDG